MFFELGEIGLVFGVICVAVGFFLWRNSRNLRFENVFRMVAEGASDGLVLMQKDAKIVWANQAYCDIMGYDLHEIIGRYPLSFAVPPGDRPSEQELRAFRFDPNDELFGTLTRMRNVRKDGTEFIHEFSHSMISHQRVLLIGRDISERVERENALIAAQQRLERLSRTDTLTGLSNRLDMRRALDDMLEKGAPFAVMQIDMNGFKEVNDTYGHFAGDALLVHFAEILQSKAKPGWVTARTGGDEFVVIVPEPMSLSAALEQARNLADAAEEPMPWNAGSISVSISVGVALYSEAGQSAEDVLNCSDVALYSAKDMTGVRVAGYDGEMHKKHVNSQIMQTEVVMAIKHGQITFHFQPIVDVEKRCVDKFEMLARWHHPEKGMIPPGVFLPVVEQLGLMDTLDRQVINAAIETLETLDAHGLSDAGLSINLSSGGLTGIMPEHLIWHAEAGRIDPARLTLEILETTAICLSEGDAATRNLNKLKAAGFKLFLDDFGMGYAGLAHLAGLNVDGIKIDRGLTGAVDEDGTSLCIVSALAQLAEQLGLKFIAEGVENETQVEIVSGIGGTLFQGFVFARPMPLSEAVRWAIDFVSDESLRETAS